MMKKLLKNSIFFIALGFVTLSFGQITVAFSPAGPINILEDGTLAEPIVVTVDNIPDGANGVTVSLRLFDQGASSFTGGEQVTTSSASGNFVAGSDADNVNTTVATVDDDAGDGVYKKVFTYKKIGSGLTVGDDLIAYVRYTNNTTALQSLTPSINFSSATAYSNPTSPTTSSKRAHFALSTLKVVATLTTSDFNGISSSIYPNPVSTIINISNKVKTQTYKVIDLQGKTVKDVEATGSIDVSDLSSGVYVLKTDVGAAKFVKK